jgi:hypothetical protein
MTWIKDPKAPAKPGQKNLIRILLRSRGLTEMWLHKNINKWINELNMCQADQVIKKVSALKIKK